MAALPFHLLRPSLPGDDSLAWQPSVDPAPSDLRRAGVVVNLNIQDMEVFDFEIDGKPIGKLKCQRGKDAALPVPQGDLDQLILLLETINAKNELYFHRWRPENETYLFLFRKHEQGQNAREIPLFDPLVEAKEKRIFELATPLSHEYSYTFGAK